MSESPAHADMPTLHCQLLVIGAGPAGVAAALTAAANGKTVLLVDQQAEPGGQIWRGQWRRLLQHQRCTDALARRWLPALHAALGATPSMLVFRGNCRVVYCAGPQTVVADGDQAAVIHYDQLILCAGAREVFLPFPGWTLPGVTGAGGLQVMVKDGVSVRGQRVVVAGTGPLLLAVAASLREAGAIVDCILEQATRRQLWRFAMQLWRYPSLLWQAVLLRWRTRGIPWRLDSWVTAALGHDRLANVQWRDGRGKQGRIACAALACGFALTENRELLALFGASASTSRLDEHPSGTSPSVANPSETSSSETSQVETDLPGVFIAGELLGIAGARRALISGQLAAAKATADLRRIAVLEQQLARWQPYQQALRRHFALRAELLALADDTTLLCRCENISVAAARAQGDFRSAKLLSRIGMGACQGRICGAACQALFGWQPRQTRAPLFPTAIRTLMAAPASTPDHSVTVLSTTRPSTLPTTRSTTQVKALPPNALPCAEPEPVARARHGADRRTVISPRRHRARWRVDASPPPRGKS